MIPLLAAWLGLSAPVPVDAGPRVLEVEVGKTEEVAVGYAIGFRCDDPAILEAAMRTRSETENVFAVRGVREGATQCRVGTDPQSPSILFEVRVVAPKRAPAKRS